ncbi:MAG: DUF4124 domain-containing protein [Proteobacteria bacterium]|nr:DUF4124 domain-containing protein [Pseudomonadota bacterium]
MSNANKIQKNEGQRMKNITLLLFFAISTNALAQTYRCTTVDGRTVFTDVKCPEAAQSEAIEVHENVLDYSEKREYQNRKEKEEEINSERSRLETLQQRPMVSSASSSTNNRECEQARRALEIEQHSSFKDKSKIQTLSAKLDIVCNMQESPDFNCQTALRNYEVETASKDYGRMQTARTEAERACGQASAIPVTPAVKARPQHQQAPSGGPCTPAAGGIVCQDGFYPSVAGGYVSPKGDFCADAAGGVACPNHFIPK